VIHLSRKKMDCRVKPGNDEGLINRIPYDPVIPLREAQCIPKRDRRVKPGDDGGVWGGTRK
jgi:hypothetical protein